MILFRRPVFVSIVILTTSECFGQGGGMGAGSAFNAYQNQPPGLQQSSYANTSEFIAVAGTAELTVKPESVRLVLAVTSESESSQECAKEVETTISKIRTALKSSARNLNFKDDDIVEDFIVVVPKYRWELGKLLGDEKEEGVVREVRDGFRMQTNLHLLCRNEQQAMAAIKKAFDVGVTEIISFDYWHSDLDRFKKEALKKALDEAKAKAEILLTVFENKPKILNLDHKIAVNFPASLYKTLTPSPALDEGLIPYGWRNKYIRIQAYRPLTTFYEGAKEYSDSSAKHPPMNPEISIVSTVTLTYGSPARTERLEIERLKKSED